MIGERIDMKTYTGTELCRVCGKKFRWEYVDYGFRQGMGEYITEVVEIPNNRSVAICNRKVVTPLKSEFFTSHCPHCQADVAIPCSENIMKELNG